MFINKGRVCSVSGCEEDAKVRSWCAKCYGSIHYWEKKPAKALIQRQIRLQLYSMRMDILTPSNVSTIKARKNSRRRVAAR